jgi:hypothetical protein
MSVQAVKNTSPTYQAIKTSKAQSQDPVDSAVNKIKDRLSTSAFDWAVTHGDVKAIADTFKGLNAQECNEVINRLSDETLNKMAQEIVDGKVFNLGGLSATERQNFFADMASKLDGQSLKKLSDAFADTDRNSGGYSYVEELGMAVAAHASNAVKVDYVKALASSTIDKPNFSEGHIYGNVFQQGDAEALAIGHVLASLKNDPSAAEQAFDSLDATQMQAIMSAAVGANDTISSNFSGLPSMITTFRNPSLAGDILSAASHIDNADLKAHIFNVGAQTLQELNKNYDGLLASTALEKDQVAKHITNGLTEIIDSDTTGVVRELAYNEDTFDGTAMSIYAKQMLKSGQDAKLGEQMARLQFGNDLKGNAIERFEQTVIPNSKNDPRYENSGAIGYFVASVYVATESITKDVEQQRKIITSVLKSTLAVIDKVNSNKMVSGAASVSKEWVQFAVDAAIQDPGDSAASQLERAAMPIDPETHEIAVGDGAISAFNDRIEQVRRLAEL